MTTELEQHPNNAVSASDFLRSQQNEEVVRTAGVPVRSDNPNSPHHDGFQYLDAFVVGVIEDAMKQISRILSQGLCTRIIFPYNPRTHFGRGDIDTAQPVRELILHKLLGVAAQHRVSVLPAIYVGPQREGDLSYMFDKNTRSLIVFEDTVEAFDKHYQDSANRFGATWDEPA